MSFGDACALVGLGVPWKTITIACPAPARITIGGDLYTPDPDGGRPACILPVCAVDPEIPELIEAGDHEYVVGYGPVVDLIAFAPTARHRWALRLGVATVLGVIPVQYYAEPVPVHRDVWGWLRAECRGIVLLTRDPREAGRILRQITAIEAEDEQHAAALRRLLRQPPPVYTTVSVRSRRRAAA